MDPYKAEYVADSIPSTMEGGRPYQVTIKFRNSGVYSWEWGVDKIGLLYDGRSSTIKVAPEFIPISTGTKVEQGMDIIFDLTITPPEQAGEQTISFSMVKQQGAENKAFPQGWQKKVIVVPEGGISSGAYGSIIISSLPQPADVQMDGNMQGMTPITISDLNPATHEITVSHPDYEPKILQVIVEPGIIKRMMVDLTSTASPDVTSEQMQKYTLLGWFLANLPLVILTIAILFLGLQFILMDTKHIPESHPIRRVAQPITFFKVNFDGKAKNVRRGDGIQATKGTSGSVDGTSDKAGKHRPGTKTEGKTSGKKNASQDRKEKREGDEESSQISKVEEEEDEIKVEDVDQMMTSSDENPMGFPHVLRDRYDPLGVEGDDPYARVFKVRAKENGLIRALKVSHMKGAGSEILQKEASVWRALHHPNIVRLYKAEYLDDMVFLENEFMNGVRYHGIRYSSLSTLPKPVNEKYAVALIRDVAEAVMYAHKVGIRHYHLQLGDVLLTNKLRAKIGGFARGKNEMGFSIPDSDVKDSNAFYITPEQRDEAKYGNPGRRTDIYQVGVIFYELLTGLFPYSKEAYERAGKEGRFEDNKEVLILPSEIRAELQKFDAVIIKMVAKDKRDRYDMLDEFFQDLL